MRTLLASSLGSDPDIAVVDSGVLSNIHSPADRENQRNVASERGAAGIDLFLFDFEATDTAVRDKSVAIFRSTGVPALLFLPTVNPEEERRFTQNGFTAVRRRPAIRSLTTPEGRAPTIDLIRAVAATRTRDNAPRPYPKPATDLTTRASAPPVATVAPPIPQGSYHGPIVAIGASTGGPQAIRHVIEEMPRAVGVPVVIVQHISIGFAEGFVRWLRDTTHRDVVIATAGLPLAVDRYIVAQSGLHLAVSNGVVELVDTAKRQFQKPSADVLFESVAAAYGSQVVAVLLTGMGRDGADGCAAVRAAGGRTVVQDEATSVVYGMPRAAIESDAADEILPLDQIGRRVGAIVEKLKRVNPRGR